MTAVPITNGVITHVNTTHRHSMRISFVGANHPPQLGATERHRGAPFIPREVVAEWRATGENPYLLTSCVVSGRRVKHNGRLSAETVEASYVGRRRSQPDSLAPADAMPGWLTALLTEHAPPGWTVEEA